MRSKKVLLCSGDRKLVLAAHQVFQTCGSTFFSAETPAEAALALSRDALNLVIVDVDFFEGAIGMLDQAQEQLPTIALTASNDLELLSSIVCTVGVANIVARPVGASEGLAELLITADKILSDDLFGLDKYLRGSDRVMRESVLTSANDRDLELRRLADFLREQNAPRQVINTIVNAADEMLTNAMYNAPVDKAGRPCYAATNRRSKISLRSSEHVQLSYGVRKNVFGISVRDQFGGLRLDHLSKSIRRCVSQHDPIEQKAGGAGLGLFLIARTARQFIINVAPGSCSEVIGLWNLDRKKIKQSHSHHSLHYFEQAYALGAECRQPRQAAGTRGVESDYESPIITIPGLGFRDALMPTRDKTVRLAPRRKSTAHPSV